MSTAIQPRMVEDSGAGFHLHVEDAFRRLDTEAHQGVAELSRYRCRYVSWGEGPPLVLIHGIADRLRSFALPMALLSKHFRCIAYDLPTGCGDGAALADYSHDLLSADLFELLDHLDLKQAVLLGHSFGSTVMLKAMAEQPQRFPRGLTLCGFVHRELSRRERALAWLGCRLPGRLRHIPLREQTMYRSHSWSFDHVEPERWRRFHRETGDAPIACVAHWAQRVHGTNLENLLPAIRQPVLVAYGARDNIVRRMHQDQLVRSLPQAARFEIANCGHFPMWTHPEAVAEAATKFLGGAACRLDSCERET